MSNHANRRALMWLIPTFALLIALTTIDRWMPDPFATYHADRARLVDDENKALCLKFVSAPELVTACTTEIGVVRQRDRNGQEFF